MGEARPWSAGPGRMLLSYPAEGGQPLHPRQRSRREVRVLESGRES